MQMMLKSSPIWQELMLAWLTQFKNHKTFRSMYVNEHILLQQSRIKRPTIEIKIKDEKRYFAIFEIKLITVILLNFKQSWKLFLIVRLVFVKSEILLSFSLLIYRVQNGLPFSVIAHSKVVDLSFHFLVGKRNRKIKVYQLKKLSFTTLRFKGLWGITDVKKNYWSKSRDRQSCPNKGNILKWLIKNMYCKSK